MLDHERQFQLFRAMVKEQLRQKGIKLSGNFSREFSAEVKRMNDQFRFNPPFTEAEIAEPYLEIIRELFKEHCEMVQRKFVGEHKDPKATA